VKRERDSLIRSRLKFVFPQAATSGQKPMPYTPFDFTAAERACEEERRERRRAEILVALDMDEDGLAALWPYPGDGEATSNRQQEGLMSKEGAPCPTGRQATYGGKSGAGGQCQTSAAGAAS
jgi:hypothetical protein